jgi:hypothetical protein
MRERKSRREEVEKRGSREERKSRREEVEKRGSREERGLGRVYIAGVGESLRDPLYHFIS